MPFKFSLPIGRRSDGEAETREVELPKEIEDRLNKTDTLESQVTTLQTSLDEKDTAISTLQARLAELEGRVAPPATPTAPATPDPILDPAGYVQHELKSRDQAMLMLMARTELDTFMREQPDWKFFGQETRELVAKMPLTQQAQRGYIENAYLIVKGRHAQEIAEGKFKNLADSADNGTPTLPLGRRHVGVTPELDEQQLAIAKRYGITEDAAKKAAAQLRFV